MGCGFKTLIDPPIVRSVPVKAEGYEMGVQWRDNR